MKNLKKIGVLISCLMMFGLSQAQDIHKSSRKGKSSLGIGLGSPYGGIGARFGTNIFDHFNVFAGVGYHISGVGYNIGILKDFKSNSSTQFYLSAMYGTNAAIKVEGLSEYDEVYTGGTFGLGIKINSRRREGNFWDFGLLLPLRSSSYNNDVKRAKNDSRISEFTEAWPVTLVVGYNFTL